jgi:hypothetical protein
MHAQVDLMPSQGSVGRKLEVVGFKKIKALIFQQSGDAFSFGFQDVQIVRIAQSYERRSEVGADHLSDERISDFIGERANGVLGTRFYLIFYYGLLFIGIEFDLNGWFKIAVVEQAVFHQLVDLTGDFRI